MAVLLEILFWHGVIEPRNVTLRLLKCQFVVSDVFKMKDTVAFVFVYIHISDILLVLIKIQMIVGILVVSGRPLLTWRVETC